MFSCLISLMATSQRPLIAPTLGVIVVLLHLGAPETGLAEPHKGPIEQRLFLAGDWGAYGFVNRSGEIVVPFKYQFAMGFAEGVAPVWIEPRRCGYIDTNGQIVIEPKYKYCRPFSEGIANVEVEDGWTFIGRDGAPITSDVFQSVSQFADGRGPAKTSDRWGYIDRDGHFAISAQYEHAWPFSGGHAIVYPLNDWRCAVIDTMGTIVFQPDGTDCRGSIETSLVIRGGPDFKSKYAYLRADGSPLTAFRFDWAEAFTEGLAAVRVDGRVGFINSQGKEIIPGQFDDDTSMFCSRGFSEGLAAVMIEGKCGFIGRTGSIKIPPRFKRASPFVGGLAYVCLDERCGYIDKTGSIVWIGAKRQYVAVPRS
jgi:WG containing repeat